ncbi:MAG: hypothetical protein M3290_06960 [Actinomycetota bacterium]|nr:hypothetical protein [Actinomycetota bacterium]
MRSVIGVLLVVSILGVLLYDGASIATNYFSLGNVAEDAVGKVADIIQSNRSQQPTTRCVTTGSHRFLDNVAWCAAARSAARDHDARLVEAYIDDTGVVHISMRRTANTLVLGRFGPTKKWVTATVQSQTVTQ